MAGRETMILWYNEKTDQLGIGGITWDYLVSLTFIPVVRRPLNPALIDSAQDPEPRMGRAEHEIAIEKTHDWVEIGEF